MRWPLARIERVIWYLLVATFAWQTRMILWQADRVFIEWRSISLYASDVLMLALFALAVMQGWRLKFSRSDWVLGAFLAAAAISIIHTDHLTVSIYQWLRLVQFVLVYFYVRSRAIHFATDFGLLAFIIGALGQSVLALGQYALQHDVGLRWLGETLLTTHMPGVAVFYDLAGVKILRVYGTLPHPNVLAVYLLTALWAMMYLYLRHAHDELGRHRWIWAVVGTPMLWALYLTFSRTMIAIGGMATVIFAVMIFWDRISHHWPNIATIRARARQILLIGAIASAVFGGIFWRQIAARAVISSQEEAVRLRIYYARAAVGSGWQHLLNLNWTGVGIGNFVTWLEGNDPGQPAWMYQPAHNLYLLVYSETGILGVGLFVAWLAMVFRTAIAAADRPGVVRWGLVMILSAFCLVALFDHFFWTLQQGRILWWIALALAAA